MRRVRTRNFLVFIVPNSHLKMKILFDDRLDTAIIPSKKALIDYEAEFGILTVF